MIRCQKCGYENVSQAEFCKECFTPLAADASLGGSSRPNQNGNSLTTDQNQPDSAPQTKGKFLSIPGKSDVPGLVRVYGVIIYVFNIVVMLLTAIWALGLLSQLGQRDAPVAGMIVLTFGLQFVIALILFILGKGLVAGKRWAVYGMCVLGGAKAIVALSVLLLASLLPATVPKLFLMMFHVPPPILLGLVAIVYTPPIAVAFRRWERFQ